MPETRYLTALDGEALHVFIMEKTSDAPSLLRDRPLLESAVMRPQMAAYYADADLVEQCALLAVGISQAQAFVDGNLAMIIENSAFWATLKATNIKFTPAIVNMPQLESAANPTSYSTYWVEGVTNNSKNADVAWDFIAYAATKRVR